MSFFDWLFGRRRRPPAPVQPSVPAVPPRTIDVILPPSFVGARIYVDDNAPGGGHVATVDGAGIAHVRASQLRWTYVTVDADGYRPYRQDAVRLPAASPENPAGDVQIRIGIQADPGFRGVQIVLPPLVKLIVGPAILGRLRVVGPLLHDDAGPYTLKPCTGFDAKRLFDAGGLPQLRAYCAWIRDVGGNAVRVFMRGWRVTGWDPGGVDINALTDFCLFLRDERLRLIGTCICDDIPVGASAQIRDVEAIADVFATFDHCVGETMNEPYNGNGEFATVMHDVQRAGLLWARGMCRPDADPNDFGDPHNRPYTPSLGVTTYQSGRSMADDPAMDDWMRKVGKDGYEIRTGFTRDFAWNNEMLGAAETRQRGRRSNDPRQFFMAGVAAGLFEKAITGHGDSETMQRCVVPGPVETACIRELFRGVDFVPALAPTWRYARRGPSNPGVPMPVEEDTADNDERMHAMVGDAEAVACNYGHLRPGHASAWHPRGINGWRVDVQDGPYTHCVKA